MDEKPFELGAIPNKQNTRIYSHKSQKHTIPPIQTKKFSAKVHTFCCINWNGKSNLRLYINNVPKCRGTGYKRIHLHMDSKRTIESFSNHLVPFIHNCELKNYIVLMDGARCHTSKETQDWPTKIKLIIFLMVGNLLKY